MENEWAQINCTYIYYVPVYFIHTSLYCKLVFNPSILRILFCAHSHKHCTPTFSFRAVFIQSRKNHNIRMREKIFQVWFFSSQCIHRMWFRYLLLLSHSFRRHFAGWASSRNLFIPVAKWWAVVPYVRLIFLNLFIHTKRIIINRSVKSIKCGISWWPHDIGHSLDIVEEFATHKSLFTRWMSSDAAVVGCVHVVHVDVDM